MKRIPLTLPIFLMIILSVNSFAQSPDDIVKTFFEDYETKGAIESLDNLYATNPWIGKNADAIQNLKNQLNAMNEELVGELRGHEPIARKTLGNSFVLMSYLVRFDRQPVRFTFEFYKPADKWITYAFMFDDKVDDEIEEAAKIQMLKNLGEN